MIFEAETIDGERSMGREWPPAAASVAKMPGRSFAAVRLLPMKSTRNGAVAAAGGMASARALPRPLAARSTFARIASSVNC
jgi:hypothetical protein